MQIGLIGSGNMARALARGWRRPVLCTDAIAERADALAAEVGGEAVGSNAELARRADLVVLCHKPAQLEEVAAEVAPHSTAVASILGGTSLAALRGAYPDVPVIRLIPSTPVEVRNGVVCVAPAPGVDPALERAVHELFAELGVLIPVAEELIDVAMALMSCAPAFWSLVVEAQVDAGVRRGLTPDRAAEMVVTTMAGTAMLLRARDMDTLRVRREVTSPAGSTARGLAALERRGVRAAFADAVAAVVDPAHAEGR
jgi:pyrroline-5-carboxylate reductase